MMALAAVQGGPRGGGDAASVIVSALLAGAVVLVWWAGRPAGVARYGMRPEQDAPATISAAAPATAPQPGEVRHADR